MNTEQCSQTRPGLQAAALTLFCLQALCSNHLVAAEETLTLLTIEGDLIGSIETLDANTDSEQLIRAYYALLEQDLYKEVEELHGQLLALIPYYEVAFIAADSAEITEVKSDIDTLWAQIRTVHAQYFTADVAGLLDDAYDSAFSTLGLKPVAAAKSAP